MDLPGLDLNLSLTTCHYATISNEGDILIHAGDFTEYGLVSEVVAFNNWMATLPHKVNIIHHTKYEVSSKLLISQHKIVIAGNHELSFDPNTLEEARDYMRQEGREGDTHKVVITIRLLRHERHPVTQYCCKQGDLEEGERTNF